MDLIGTCRLQIRTSTTRYTVPMQMATVSYHVCTKLGLKLDSLTQAHLQVYALEDLYASLDVPDTDIQKAWDLVNPKNAATIGKDQAFAFLHVLNNRHEGYRIKWTVPASLRSTFEKNQIDYNVSNVRSLRARDNEDGTPTFTSKKSAFGESYLTRLGIGGRGYTPSGKHHPFYML